MVNWRVSCAHAVFEYHTQYEPTTNICPGRSHLVGAGMVSHSVMLSQGVVLLAVVWREPLARVEIASRD